MNPRYIWWISFLNFMAGDGIWGRRVSLLCIKTVLLGGSVLCHLIIKFAALFSLYCRYLIVGSDRAQHLQLTKKHRIWCMNILIYDVFFRLSMRSCGSRCIEMQEKKKFWGGETFLRQKVLNILILYKKKLEKHIHPWILILHYPWNWSS